MLDQYQNYEKIDSCRSRLIAKFEEWLSIPAAVEGLDQVCIMTGMPAFVATDDGYLLHPMTSVMFFGVVEGSRDFVKRLYEFGGFKVFEGDGNG